MAVVLIVIVTIENKTIDIPFYQIIHAVSEPGLGLPVYGLRYDI